ncbi:MAG: NAD(P)H-dependent oxidoreductase subunit E, partial [Halopseudomonas sp.]
MTTDSRSRRKQRPQRGHRVDQDALLEVKQVVADTPLQADLLIELLHLLQDRFGQLKKRHLVALAELLKLAPTEVHEVASFYHHFDLTDDASSSAPLLKLRVCNSLSCQMAGSESLLATLSRTLGDRVQIQPVPCVGRCDTAPVTVLGQRVIAAATEAKVQRAVETNQTTALLPAKAEDYASYRKKGGYRLLQQLDNGELSRGQVLDGLDASGLRGLGGAGFPVGRKWRLVSEQPAPRYLTVNIDEGEPGTFKDRHYLEQQPHRLLEGALIAARVVGCDAIYLYLRDEYAGCRALLQREIAALQ